MTPHTLPELRELFKLAFGADDPRLSGMDAALASKDPAYIDAALAYYAGVYARSEGDLLAWLRGRELSRVEGSPLAFSYAVDVTDAEPSRGPGDVHARTEARMALDVPSVARVTFSAEILSGPEHVIARRVDNILSNVRRAILGEREEQAVTLARARNVRAAEEPPAVEVPAVEASAVEASAVEVPAVLHELAEQGTTPPELFPELPKPRRAPLEIAPSVAS